MALSAGTILKSELDTEFAANTSALTTNAKAGAKDWQVDLDLRTLLDTTNVGKRTVDFTAPDDCELRVMGFSAFGDGSGSASTTLTLSCVDSSGAALTDPLLGKTIDITASVASGATTETNATRDDYQASTGDKHFLRKGNTYRLQVATASTVGLARFHGYVLLRSRRRRA